jgi:HSP20 family protein
LEFDTVSWQSFTSIETIRRQLDRTFDELAAIEENSQTSWMPAVELQDAGDNFLLKAQLPGIDPKDIDIQVTREAVSISGSRAIERKEEKPKFVRSEFRYGQFHRVIPLPARIQNDLVHAEYKDGILTLTLPKVIADRNQVVKVNLTQITEPSATPAVEESDNN